MAKLTMAAWMAEEEHFETDCHSDSSQDADECLRELLGGVSFDGLSAGAWEQGRTTPDASSYSLSSLSFCQQQLPASSSRETFIYADVDEASEVLDILYENSWTSDGSKPPVRVVATTSSGNGLIATKNIRKGAVIYTERALLAAQHDGASVRGCQNCFRSLEPISKLSKNDLPCPNLWPVPEFRYTTTQQQQQHQQEDSSLIDDFGRVACKNCESLFCTDSCQRQYAELLGSCCALTSVTRSLDDPALALSIKLLVYSLQLYRKTGGLEGSLLHGLCGDAEDVTSLELGEFDPSASKYSLQTLYDRITTAYDMTVSEKAVILLECFEKLAATAARNGVGLMTQSPFKSYYEAVLRSTGGRGSAQHDSIKQSVALALGSIDGSLQRGMDREMNDLVAVQVSALFVLTARINHSCAPNAVIQSQVFCDAHMDLVALRDIQRGEEITISYIGTGPGVGKKSTPRRRRELQSKYLFLCACSECAK